MTGSLSRNEFDTATRLYALIDDPNARAFIDYLIDHPDAMIDSEGLQNALGFSEHRNVALAAYSIGEMAAALGLKRPWTEAQRGYVMSETQGSLYRQAREVVSGSAANDMNATGNA